MYLQVFISETDMAHMVASCPALRQLMLSSLTAPVAFGPLFKPLTQLHALTLNNVPHKPLIAPTMDSLHHLQGLSRLEISSKSYDDFLVDMQRLGALASLSLTVTSCSIQGPPFRNLSEFSRLGNLQRLTHLTLDCRPSALQVLGGVIAAGLAHDLHRLVRLELSCFRLQDGAAEALAELQHLTQLSVWDMQPLHPMDNGPPCSWKELTLFGEQHWLEGLTYLPLTSLERICMGSGILHLLFPKEDGAEMAAYIDGLRDSAAILASKLGAGGSSRANKAGLILRLQPNHATAAGLFAALIPLRGVFFHTLDLELHKLQDSHVRELRGALPRLRRLMLRTKDLSVSAWACLGAELPFLKMFVLSSDEQSFQPEHMALLASSLAHPLAVAVDAGGVAAALAGLRVLQAVRHMGASFITLKERVSPAGDWRRAEWKDVCVPVMVDWWRAR